MSYCRFSSDNHECDLYCYASCHGGYVTHVANNRHDGEIPKADVSLISRTYDTEADFKAAVAEYLRQHNIQSEWLKTAERKPIGLPHDGATFQDPDLESFRATLLMLRAEGYRFPDGVLYVVDAEIQDQEVPA